MPKIMLINVTHSEESRVAIINDGVLESFEIESLSREHLKGNIYKGIVQRIHPALEAAFVDIGAERDAFLPLDEVCFKNLPAPPPPPPPAPAGDDGRRRPRLRDILKPGEEILVQIAKEQFANKPPTLTTFYSLPGRHLVLLPGADETVGISRRIEGEDRQRLRQLLTELNPPEGFGIIVRTAAGLDQDIGELSGDLAYLQRLWTSVRKAAAQKRAPALVYREHDIVLRTIRDFFAPDIDEIHVDNEDVFLRAQDFLQQVMPAWAHVLRCYRGEQPIFSAFDVEMQIESIFKRRVQLRSGGSIVIDGTEALTAIDVNSGGSMRNATPEETSFRTNLEAAREVARQLRLRDIGGLIVVDFIDMRDQRHIQEVEQALREALSADKARHELGRISRFGLMEISRQRLRPAAMASTYTACPMCEGHGAVRTTESAALVALRKIHHRVALGDVAALRAALPPAVAVYLLNQKRGDLARLEQRYDTRVAIELKQTLLPHQIEIEARPRAAERLAAVPPGGVASADHPAAATAVSDGAVAPAAAATDAGGAAAADDAAGGTKKRRRRGRRRGSGLRAAVAIGEGLAALGESIAPADTERRSPDPVSPPASGAVAAGIEPAAREAVRAEPAGSGETSAADAAQRGGSDEPRRRASRGRGRRGGRRGGARTPVVAAAEPVDSVPSAAPAAAMAEVSAVTEPAERQPRQRPRGSRGAKTAKTEAAGTDNRPNRRRRSAPAAESGSEATGSEPEHKPRRPRPKRGEAPPP